MREEGEDERIGGREEGGGREGGWEEEGGNERRGGGRGEVTIYNKCKTLLTRSPIPSIKVTDRQLVAGW